jgi:hypothetical protein
MQKNNNIQIELQQHEEAGDQNLLLLLLVLT